MFSSCAELIITGDSKIDEQIKHAITLVMDGYGFKPEAFHMLPDGRAILYERMPEDKYQAGLIEITKDIVMLVLFWLW